MAGLTAAERGGESQQQQHGCTPSRSLGGAGPPSLAGDGVVRRELKILRILTKACLESFD